MRGLFLFVVILLAAYVGYPYLTLYWLDQALLTGDKQALEQLVDFPRVRADLKAEIKAKVIGKAEATTEKRPILGTIGAALAELIAPPVVDKGVDAMVTPESILNNPTVVEHRERDESFIDFITYAFFSGPTTFTFDLKDPEEPNSPTVTAIMRLTGFSWRVVELDLPPGGSWL